jgi:hypothetical protein
MFVGGRNLSEQINIANATVGGGEIGNMTKRNGMQENRKGMED